MTKKQRTLYHGTDELRAILKQALEGQKFVLDCGHHITFHQSLGNDITICIKRRYEAAIIDGYFLTKRGEKRPADKNEINTLDSSEYGKMLVSWMCQRPNLASNEKKLFDELYNGSSPQNFP